MKHALITGVAGQDGSYLAEHLLALGYRVYGTVRRDQSASPVPAGVNVLYADMRDNLSLETAFRKSNPDEVYNLAAQVFIPTSWTQPAETFDVNVGGLARLLRIVEEIKPDTRVYQASSSEMYGNTGGLLNEQSPFVPVSPYGAAKLAAHQLCGIYRERGFYVCGGILFNHESPRRGAEMVTRKITLAGAAWARGGMDKVALGNLGAKRDWGYAGDYVRAMHLMLQQETPKDYVIATGETHTVGEFVRHVLEELHYQTHDERFLGPIENFVSVNPAFVRANELRHLLGDSSAAELDLGWKPQVYLRELVRMMLAADIERTPNAG